MINRITSFVRPHYAAVALAIIGGIIPILILLHFKDPFVVLGSYSVAGLLLAGALGICLKLYDMHRLRTQKNLPHRQYIEQRLELFMQHRVVYRAACPYTDEKVQITAMSTLFRKKSFLIAFINEEYVCAGESNGNINERQVVTYMLASHEPDIPVARSTSQIYAEQTVHSSTPPTYEMLRHLPDDLFSKLEEVLISWQQSTADI